MKKDPTTVNTFIWGGTKTRVSTTIDWGMWLGSVIFTGRRSCDALLIAHCGVVLSGCEAWRGCHGRVLTHQTRLQWERNSSCYMLPKSGLGIYASPWHLSKGILQHVAKRWSEVCYFSQSWLMRFQPLWSWCHRSHANMQWAIVNYKNPAFDPFGCNILHLNSFGQTLCTLVKMLSNVPVINPLSWLI